MKRRSITKEKNRAGRKTCRGKKKVKRKKRVRARNSEGEKDRKKESLLQKPRGYPAIPECSALTYFGISVSVFVSAAL